MQTLWQDIRYGIRMLRKSPGFTSASVICLALGIGATTAIFSIVNTVLLRPLPYAHPDRLVRLYTEFPNFHKFWLSAPELLTLQRDTKSWQSIDGWVNGGVNLTGRSEPVRVTASYVTGGLFQSLGVGTAVGRPISPADDAPSVPNTATLSYGLWQRAFGGDRAIVGRDVQVNGQKCTIVGIMPKGFQFPPGETDPPEMWMPLQIDPAKPGSPSGHYLSILARLKPGVTVQRANEEMQQVIAGYGLNDQRVHHLSKDIHPISMWSFQEEVVGSVRLAMLMLLGAVAFVLLIACVNVANLLLARAEARQREIAIRKALGAAYGTLARQFITEGILLALAGAVAGLALAFVGLRVIAQANGASIPRANEMGLDPWVLGFTLGVSLLTGIAFGLAPMAQIIAGNVHDTLKAAALRTTASVGSNRFRRALVVSELALALILLIGTGLMIRAFWKLQEVHAGIRPEGLLTFRVALPQAVYPDRARVLQLWLNIEQRMSSLPGVEMATVGGGLPPVRQLNANDTQIEGWVQTPKGPIQNIDYYQTAGHKYFETLGIRLIEGRYFDDRDGETAPQTLIVNQTTARTYWPGQSAIGHRMKPGFQGDWRTIVGVVEDVKNAGLDKPVGTEIFVPIGQSGNIRAANIVLKTRGDPMKLASAARGVIREIDAGLPVAALRTMDEVISSAQSRPRFLTMLLTLFSSVALILAAVGIYGVISYSVAQRTSEFGIRMAMGASQGNVLGMVLKQGLIMGGIGVAIGAAGALALTRLIRGLLFGISSFDPVTFLVMAAILTAVTLTACFVPARRATKVDPMVALRYE
jgi:putative ABC transport system permease protein